VTQIIGGLRHRLIKESLYAMIKDSLTSLGWFDPGRVNNAVTLRTVPFEQSQEIPANTAVLSTEDLTGVEGELGSNMGDFSWTCYLDFYAESDAVGQHFIGDVFEVLSGRMSSIGRGRTSFAVYDYRQPTPPLLFYCDLEEVVIDRAHDFPNLWQKHWFAARFFVIDAYGDENS
jgi:hypothetical protein